MKEGDFDDYERRSRLYYAAFEEYASLNTTYRKFYAASHALQKRGRFLTFSSTLLGGILLFIIGSVVMKGEPGWATDLAFGVSVLVAGFSFVNAVDNPQQMANVTYNSGQTLQRVFLDFHEFVTVDLPDPDKDLEELEEQYERLLERKHIVNETTPSIGNKWFHRVPEKHKNWKPKPLIQVTGKDGEFKPVSGEEQEPGAFKRLVVSPLIWIKREMGY